MAYNLNFMTNLKITQEEAQKILERSGKIRGEAFKTDEEFIIRKEGDIGMDKLKKEGENLGIEFPYGKLDSLEWYPLGLRTLSFALLVQVLGWGEEQIKEMGYNAPQSSFIMKFIIKKFYSMKKVFESTPRYWKKHYTIGKIDPYEIDLEKKYCILRIYDFNAHHLFCSYWQGYFKRIGEYSGEDIEEVELSKAMYKGDSYNEFIIRWK